MKLSDEETSSKSQKNRIFNRASGLSGEKPFDSSFMTHFYKRLGFSIINQINEWIVEAQTKPPAEDDHNDAPSGGGDGPRHSSPSGTPKEEGTQKEEWPNQGKLLLDATCAPADIAYPTDLRLLNEVREKLEGIIDTLHVPFRGQQRKPRTYQEKARRAYLSVAKQRDPRKKTIRKAVRKQLNFVKRKL